MLAIALVARAIVHAPRATSSVQPAIVGEDTDTALWARLRAQADTPRLAMPASPLGIPDNEAYLPWSDEFPMPAQRGTPRWLTSLLVLGALGLVSALGFRIYQRYQAQNEAAVAAQHAAEQKRADDLAAQKAQLAAREAEQAKAAEERLAAMLNGAAKPQPEEAEAATQPAAPAVEEAAKAPELAAPEPAKEPEAPVQALAVADQDHEADKAAREAAAERKVKRAEKRAKKKLKVAKAERAQKAKQRAEQKSVEAAQRSVGKTLSASDDPILGLLED
jgi:outer membrane biosynthesis protein TonB